MTAAPTFAFVKGHGTQNDFVVVDDPDVRLDLTERLVSALCDRQRGIGADGVLRVASARALVAAGVLGEFPDGVGPDDWFMDYRNADGSIAEMCGNGVRVFAHYLRTTGLVDSDSFTVGSRAGGRPVVVHSCDPSAADVSVAMGRVRLDGRSDVQIAGRTLTGERVDVGNPHLACVVDELSVDELGALDLTTGAVVDAAAFPHGANVEILTALQRSDHDVDFTAHMRVFERGVGETRSCGTGLVAAASAALHGIGRDHGVVGIAVPGGTVVVTVADGAAVLRGPSRLVARGELLPEWSAG
ncbi:diaminopimelate epimerase [Gordonia liuliyuniae]|uniref:Diaminopimelate epimerase n=1 Tax=Gordonia liuliyuniae TaxID=2911517 RepID=A0ABS9IRE5_9ACTN|nr:diaminopimelate epimerase [Gordonia liuliyuniae]MCF8588128.1 diaminopimelate epimerase [Gordonia liuliyuniae]